MNAQARIGLIIPSSNRLTEPQFNRYAPSGVDTHVTRLRMTGQVSQTSKRAETLAGRSLRGSFGRETRHHRFSLHGKLDGEWISARSRDR